MPKPVDVQLAAYQATLRALGYRLEFPERDGEAKIRWVDLFGIDPDYTDGLSAQEFIDRNRGEQDGE